MQIYTDHKNLVYFMEKQRLNSRQLRWATFSADFNFVIQYRPGKSMAKADALSRRQEFMDIILREKEIRRALLPKEQVDPLIFDELEEQRSVQDEKTNKVYLVMFE